jgi:hypothetical protein
MKGGIVMADCKVSMEQLSLYIDDMLDERKRISIDEHLNACPACKGLIDGLKSMVEDCGSLEELEPPDYLAPMIMGSIRKEARKTSGRWTIPGWAKNIKVVSATVAALLMLAVVGTILPDAFDSFIGMKKSESSMDHPVSPAAGPDMAGAEYDTMGKAGMGIAPSYNAGQAEMQRSAPSIGGDGAETRLFATADATDDVIKEQSVADARKIIMNSEMSIEVESFDDSFKEIQRMTEQSRGFIQSSNSYVRRSGVGDDIKDYKEGHITLRIPSSEFNTVLSGVEKLGKVINSSVSGSDITKQYVDTEARLRSKEIQQERLLDILSRAERVEDILRIEEELNRVRTEIEMYASQISNWDNLVQYSTINIYMREVELKDKQVNPPGLLSLWNRIKGGFITTTNWLLDLVESVVVGIGYALPVVAVAGAGYYAWHRARKKKTL